jgi:DNA-binding NarL/FixJ family response regulator
VLRRRFDPEEQAIFEMLLAGIKPQDIADTLELSAARLESRQWAMLRRLDTLQSREPLGQNGTRGR